MKKLFSPGLGPAGDAAYYSRRDGLPLSTPSRARKELSTSPEAQPIFR